MCLGKFDKENQNKLKFCSNKREFHERPIAINWNWIKGNRIPIDIHECSECVAIWPYEDTTKNVLFRSPVFSYKAFNAFKAFFVIELRTWFRSNRWIICIMDNSGSFIEKCLYVVNKYPITKSDNEIATKANEKSNTHTDEMNLRTKIFSMKIVLRSKGPKPRSYSCMYNVQFTDAIIHCSIQSMMMWRRQHRMSARLHTM